ncbi:MAG: hypothetical protein V1743_03810 [Nanoarchaeota archaeon]
MLLGITGTNTVGKTAASSYLISRGFSYYSHWDVVREELEKMSKEQSYENLQQFDLLARKKLGDSYWIKRVLSRIKEEFAVIDGIGFVQEVTELKKRKDFFLVGIYAPAEIKLERAWALSKSGMEMQDRLKDKKRLRSRNAPRQEVSGLEREQIELSKVMQMIDFSVANEGNISKIYAALENILRKAAKK